MQPERISGDRGALNAIRASRNSLGLSHQVYIDGVKPPTSPSPFLGKMCHAALECHYRHRQLGVTIEAAVLLRRLVESWDPAAADEAVPFESGAEEDACRLQAIGLVGAYLAQLPSDEPKPLAIEAALVDPASGENLGIPLVGIMDLVLPERDGPLIADFKTTARGGEPLAIAHEIQLSSYSYLFRHSSQYAESALEIRSLIKTKTPKIETHRYAARDERHFRRLFAVIRAYLDDLDAGRFVFRPGFGCSMCDFRDTHCREWDG